VRYGIALLGCAFLVLVVGAVPSAGSTSAYDPRVTFTYKGTFDSRSYTASSLDGAGKATFLSPKKESWTWTYSWTGKLSALRTRRPVTFKKESMRGTVTRTDELPGKRSGDCKFTYASKPGAYPLNVLVQVPYRAGKGDDWKAGTVTFVQFPPVQTDYAAVSSASDPKGNGHCRTIGPSPALAATFPPAMGSVFRFVDLSRPSIRDRRYDRIFPHHGEGPGAVELLKSSITLRIMKIGE
jgi:hypothetical protein